MALEKLIEVIMEKLNVSEKDATIILEKSNIGQEITPNFNVVDWLNNRLLPNCVLIGTEGYSKMCVDALKILTVTAATDYGSSRQRDLGHLWADMTRGYLGEYAFIKFLDKRFGIKATLDHSIGALAQFLPTDIHLIKKPGEDFREPKINISVKTTKWNGIWLDIPGDQFNHSDIHVLIKIGAGREHLFAFFKDISVFKDKVLKKGQEVGSLTEDEAKNLFDSLPSFKPIPAYICGFAIRDKSYESLPYTGKMGRKNYKILSWNGPIRPGNLEEIKIRERVPGKVSFEGIGDFSHDTGHLFNSGSLLWEEKDWEYVIERT